MIRILDRVGNSATFRPQSVDQFFALQLARKLRDEDNLNACLRLTEEHARSRLLKAFHRAKARTTADGELARAFEVELGRLTHAEPHV